MIKSHSNDPYEEEKLWAQKEGFSKTQTDLIIDTNETLYQLLPPKGGSLLKKDF